MASQPVPCRLGRGRLRGGRVSPDRAEVVVDLDAIAENVALTLERVAPAQVWAVVKAGAYGHGDVAVAAAALTAGASGLCVATVEEGERIRSAGIDAPLLLLSQQSPRVAERIVAARLTPTLYAVDAMDALVSAGAKDLPVHVKVDTGMQRVGVRPDGLSQLVAALAERSPALRLEGIYTHLAVADRIDDPGTNEQLERFETALAELDLDGVLIHAANSAGALVHPGSRRDLVRLGIAMYGLSPGDDLTAEKLGLRPALTLRARVGHVKRVEAGSSISYGWRHTFDRATTVATVPIGYADGVPRRLSSLGGEVLIGGRRHRMVGVVTMDQLMVDVGDAPVAVDDEVVLIGSQGGERIGVAEWSAMLGTIDYEVVCGISARVPRRSIGG